MLFKQIITLTLLLLLFQGCSKTYKHDYDNRSFFGISQDNNTPAGRDLASVNRSENPMARPSYKEYRDLIKDKKFEPK